MRRKEKKQNTCFVLFSFRGFRFFLTLVVRFLRIFFLRWWLGERAAAGKERDGEPLEGQKMKRLEIVSRFLTAGVLNLLLNRAIIILKPQGVMFTSSTVVFPLFLPANQKPSPSSFVFLRGGGAKERKVREWNSPGTKNCLSLEGRNRGTTLIFGVLFLGGGGNEGVVLHGNRSR